MRKDADGGYAKFKREQMARALAMWSEAQREGSAKRFKHCPKSMRDGADALVARYLHGVLPTKCGQCEGAGRDELLHPVRMGGRRSGIGKH